MASVCFPKVETELVALLEQDQKQYKAFVHDRHYKITENLERSKAELQSGFKQRAERSLQLLTTIVEPSVSNIGHDGATALAVLASHYSYNATKVVLDAFKRSYTRDPQDTHYQSIPPMADWVAIVERRPQRFGTIWLMDKRGWPFLPTVEDFTSLDNRRETYGIGPLRWPKSLAIPESEQPWLKHPLTTSVMRDLTEKEYSETVADLL